MYLTDLNHLQLRINYGRYTGLDNIVTEIEKLVNYEINTSNNNFIENKDYTVQAVFANKYIGGTTLTT